MGRTSHICSSVCSSGRFCFRGIFFKLVCREMSARRMGKLVSTHSRPKAAGLRASYDLRAVCGFNTQPPEGGWLSIPEIIQELRKTFENELVGISDLELQELIEDLFASHENKPKEVEQSEEIKQSEKGKLKRRKP